MFPVGIYDQVSLQVCNYFHLFRRKLWTQNKSNEKSNSIRNDLWIAVFTTRGRFNCFLIFFARNPELTEYSLASLFAFAFCGDARDFIFFSRQTWSYSVKESHMRKRDENTASDELCEQWPFTESWREKNSTNNCNEVKRKSGEAPKIRLNGTISIELLVNTVRYARDKRISGKGAVSVRKKNGTYTPFEYPNNSKNNQIQLTGRKGKITLCGAIGWGSEDGSGVFGWMERVILGRSKVKNRERQKPNKGRNKSFRNIYKQQSFTRSQRYEQNKLQPGTVSKTKGRQNPLTWWVLCTRKLRKHAAR